VRDNGRMQLACIDGKVMPADEAMVPATDEGLLRGDGVFEVLRLYGGRPFALDEHLRRLARSGSNLRLAVDSEQIRADVDALLTQSGPVEGLLRLLVTRGGRRLALVEPLPDLPETVRVGYVTYAPTRVLDGVKSLSYAANMHATRLARERGFDEALLVTPHGRVLEAPTSSFFWARDGVLRTPPLSEHVLASITRSRLTDLIDVVEEPCTSDDLAGAEEAFLASTVREVMPVSAIEETQLEAPGPITAEAGRRLQARIAEELAAQPA
jgi:branched-chain amino acid aminotransferase